MKKKKSKRGLIILLIIVFILLVAGIVGGYFFYQSKRLRVEYDKKVTVNIFDTYLNTKAVKKIKNGTLKTKEKEVDTSKLGKQKIIFSVEDYFKSGKGS